MKEKSNVAYTFAYICIVGVAVSKNILSQGDNYSVSFYGCNNAVEPAIFVVAKAAIRFYASKTQRETAWRRTSLIHHSTECSQKRAHLFAFELKLHVKNSADKET